MQTLGLQCESDVKVHQFRRKLAIRLINNDHATNDSETKKILILQRRHRQHFHKSTPSCTKSHCMVREIWIREAKDLSQRHVCKSKNCKNR